ncbi:hypothetical protein LTR04_005083 [Oleoguttula sp. CCFEE 6159]|nr:hypothetical protein LTR04_005083 [Oleoguttula sp. CCFEE 6159]
MAQTQPRYPIPTPSTLADTVTGTLSTWAGNFSRNTSTAFGQLRVRDYIRLIVIVGAYCLLRPYLIKIGAKIQAADHARPLDPNEMHSSAAAMSPNQLRGGRGAEYKIPGVDSEDEEEEDGEVQVGAGGFGRKARLRQRRLVREKLAEVERMRLQEEGEKSDREIEEFLVD